ncbi:hypothetical protein VA249_45450 (plasmid) [Vibrio alfacsensis]|uniref:DUF2913 family protein n=1 Tax=Vibrio alfacsensis TaxID=1074311 RepID=UPI001BEE5EBB|nr:DUF2913 family protein [Vibrio alfacsensis]BBM67899.1 hypothetical protein VA249_45450 [Vibrio alfacsensis]
MKNNDYHQQLKSAIEAVLFNLYFAVAQIKKNKGTKHVPVSVRNKIITDFTKPLVKLPKYKLVKKNLKTISLMGDKFGAIELKLNEILDGYSNLKQPSAVDNLYILLSKFEDKGIKTMLIEETPQQEANVVYLHREHIDHCFDDLNKQCAPISLLINTNDLNVFLSVLMEQQLFNYSLLEQNTELGSYHYQLHPIDM